MDSTIQTYDTDKLVQEAKQAGVPVIDVRPADMYEEGHIPGAVNIPLDQIKNADVKPGSVLYCMTGYHAGMAQEILRRRGIKATDIGGMEFYHGPVEA
ncbi:rhodanese-like domain-containing protein [uncultured Faecalibaculum sp.]|uniref:rhodanese-like domain-containing protein n=1 Tax=uncultured Faecalibaculum sp. TaxID=1729681 RepID=UPI0025DD9031|nr:rhodanese-like domain-containing protein [uncultured Faecalibaculum sp.]